MKIHRINRIHDPIHPPKTYDESKQEIIDFCKAEVNMRKQDLIENLDHCDKEDIKSLEIGAFLAFERLTWYCERELRRLEEEFTIEEFSKMEKIMKNIHTKMAFELQRSE